MAFGQIDPARLQGDALTRWYLRSPAEIEAERRQSAEQAYNAFFGQSGDTPPGAQPTNESAPPPSFDGSAPPSSQVGGNGWGADRAPSDATPNLNGSSDGSYQVAVALAPAAGSGGWICQACHGNGVAVPPPALFTPGRGSGGQPPHSGSGDGSSGNNPKQCAIQNENDASICRWIPGTDARRRCWESAAKREAHCISSKGEVGYPDLITW